MFIIFSVYTFFIYFPLVIPNLFISGIINHCVCVIGKYVDLQDKIKFNIFIQQIVINRIYKAHTIRKLTMRFN